jgi:signal transduction histidine kinase
MDKPMNALEPTVLLISHSIALCSAVRAALESREPPCRITSVATFAGARHTVADLSPDVIVLEESSLRLPADAQILRAPLADAVAALARFAPVIVLGDDQPPDSLAALIAAGAADFVQAGQSLLPDATACVEKRLQTARRLNYEFVASDVAFSSPELGPDENFGAILRHELNNPLTGILGNAELLLAEVRRQKTAQLSEVASKRLEIIAALAVRMRETVRNLSQAYESRREHARLR